LAVLWQSEVLAWPSAVSPLHAGLLISHCFSTKPSIGGGSIKIVHPKNLKIKPQAQSFFSSVFDSDFSRQSPNQQNKRIMSDKKTPRQVEYGYEDGRPQ
jgi:hypothetical protein